MTAEELVARINGCVVKARYDATNRRFEFGFSPAGNDEVISLAVLSGCVIALDVEEAKRDALDHEAAR